MLQKILHFLGGKPPKIFNDRGAVEHKLPKKKWEEWEEKNRSNPEYNWKQHKGKTSQVDAHRKPK